MFFCLSWLERNFLCSKIQREPFFLVAISIYLSLHLSISPSLHLSIHPTIHPSICLSIYLLPTRRILVMVYQACLSQRLAEYQRVSICIRTIYRIFSALQRRRRQHSGNYFSCGLACFVEFTEMKGGNVRRERYLQLTEHSLN